MNLYKIAAVIFVCFILCVCSCGCQNATQETDEPTPDTDLSLITPVSGIDGGEIAVINNSFYTIKSYSDASADILRYDLETLEIGKISSEPDLDIMGGAIASAGDRLLVFKAGHVPYSDIYEGSSSVIYVLDTTGEVEAAITLPAQQRFKSNSAVAFDGDDTVFLMLCLCEDGDSNPVCVQDELCSIELTTGEISSLKTFSTDTDAVISGVCPDGIVLTTADSGTQSQSVYIISDSGSASTEDISFDFLGSAYTYVSDGNGGYYYINRDEDVLMFGSIYGGTKAVAEHLNITEDAAYAPYIASNVCSSHLAVDLDNSLTAVGIYVNLATGEIIKAPERGFSCRVVFEGENYVILDPGKDYINTILDAESDEYGLEEGAAHYLAAPKDEFWQGSAEYFAFNNSEE